MREACCRSNRCSPLSSDDPSVLEPAAPAAPTSPSRPRRLTVLRVLPLAARSPCPALLDGSGQGGASWADLANALLYCGSGLVGRHPFVGGKPNLNFHSAGTKFHFNRCAFFTLSGGVEEVFCFCFSTIFLLDQFLRVPLERWMSRDGGTPARPTDDALAHSSAPAGMRTSLCACVLCRRSTACELRQRPVSERGRARARGGMQPLSDA